MREIQTLQLDLRGKYTTAADELPPKPLQEPGHRFSPSASILMRSTWTANASGILVVRAGRTLRLLCT